MVILMFIRMMVCASPTNCRVAYPPLESDLGSNAEEESEFPILWPEFDLDSSLGDLLWGEGSSANGVHQFCKCMIVKELVALTGIDPVFAAFSCLL